MLMLIKLLVPSNWICQQESERPHVWRGSGRGMGDLIPQACMLCYVVQEGFPKSSSAIERKCTMGEKSKVVTGGAH